MNIFLFSVYFDSTLIQHKIFIDIDEMLREIKKYENELEYKILIEIRYKGMNKNGKI